METRANDALPTLVEHGVLLKGATAMTTSPSSTISWKCRGCSQDIRVPERLAGKQLICPKCSARQLVPAAGPSRTGQQSRTPAGTRAPSPAAAVQARQQATRRAVPLGAVAAIGICGLVMASVVGVALSRAMWRGRDATGRSPHAEATTEKISRGDKTADTVGPPAGSSEKPVVATETTRGASESDGSVIELPPIRTLEELRSGLSSFARELASIPADSPASENMRAMLRLREYRFLCGVPEEDIALDDGFNADAAAAAEACRRLGRLTHEPENPGMSADAYERARRGAGSGNLASGMNNLSKAVDCWMDDSDSANIAVLGHRRWCLNPPLQRVGFGRTDRWCAMWAHDHSGTAECRQRAICFPPPGHVPIEMFRPHYAWSVTLNPRFFQKPKPGDISVTVHPRQADGRVGESLPLSYCDVDTKGCGIDNCIIFMPSELSTAVGKQYLVTIANATTHDNEPRSIRFVVDFVDF